MNYESNEPENFRSPTEKKSVVVGVRREQVMGNDPLDPLSMLARQSTNGTEDVPAIPSYSNTEPSKSSSSSKYSQPMDHPFPLSQPVGVNTMYDSLRQPADKIEQMAEAFIRSCRAQPLPLANISSDLAGLNVLVSAQAWSSVVSLSSKLCRNAAPVENSKLSPVYQYRFEGLFRMKMYDDLLHEVTAILSEEETKLRNLLQLNASASVGAMHNITFSLRLLIVEVKLMTGRSQEALEQLARMHLWLNDKLLSASEEADILLFKFWLWQVRLHCINAHIRLRNYKAVCLELKALIDEAQERYAKEELDQAVKMDLMQAQIVLLTRLSRVLLQLGDLKRSTFYFEEASRLYAFHVGKVALLQQLLQLNQALLLFSTEQYKTAAEVLSKVVDSDNSLVSSSSFQKLTLFNNSSAANAATAVDAESFFNSDPQTSSPMNLPAPSAFVFTAAAMVDLSEDFVITAAINNFSICALYRKNITEAVHRLENIIRENPVRFMTDPIIFNLCTLYDLSFATDVSTNKKKILQKVASKYHIEDPMVHWRSFRLN